MHRRRRRSFVARALPVALALPLLAFGSVAYAVYSDPSDTGSLALAEGSVDGSFHPVAGTFEPDATSLEDCDGDFGCLEQAFGNLSFREGPKPALALFEERMASDPSVEADCHRIVHSIGSAAFARYDGNVARTFSEGSPVCISGYYHGILERSFVGVTSTAQLRQIARSLCVGEGIRRRGFLDYQCRHGLGHGLMIQTGYDLPLSLSLCAGLGTRWDHLACAGGVFMENLDTRFGYRSPWLDDSDPLYPCAQVGPQDRHSCYLRASRRVLAFEGEDFAKAGETCALLTGWSRTCFRGLGRDAVEIAEYAPGKVVSLCGLLGIASDHCLRGAARTIANASGSPGVRQAAAFCARVPRAARDACYAGMGGVLGLLHPTDASRKAACAKLAGRHEPACTRAAIAEVDPSGREAWG